MEDNEIGGNPFEESGISDSNFFDALDKDVNGLISDTNEKLESKSEATQQQQVAPQTVTHNKTDGPKNDPTDWEKRYKDSSREAQKMNGELSNLKPFVPLLDAMKNDSGLVEHVRGYLQNGGAPKTVKDNLGLDEDFVFDQHEALDDPDSDSAKLFNATVEKVVNKRVNGMLSQEKERNQKIAYEKDRNREEADFKKKHKMSDEDFNIMVDKSKDHVLSLEDVHTLVNQDKVKANTAKATKEDMLNQMRTVRDIPSSISGTNSQGNVEKSADDQIFDALTGSDGDLDNLFG
tara:strand:- start:1244 stop:2116 length:873 start_codon:yes stop_codon:yes gene_type:complete